MPIPSLDQEILRRQAELLYRNLKPGQWTSIINALILGLVNEMSLGPSVIIWTVLALCVAGFRLHLGYRHDRAAASGNPLASEGWLRQARLGAGLAGLVWAGGGFLMMQDNRVALQFFSAFVFAGMVAGAVPVLAADRFSFRIYAWPVVIAIIIGNLGSDLLHLAFCGMSALFLVMVTRSADYINDTLTDTIRLEVRHAEVVQDLKESHATIAKAARSRSEFLANISHELRTPLNGVLGMTQLMEMTPLNPEQQDYLGTLKQSTNNLVHQIERLIELASLEARQAHAHPIRFATLNYLSDTLTQFRPGAEAKGLQLALHLDPQMPPTLVGDSDALGRILHLLVENAIKFTHQGQVEVSARVASLHEDGTADLEFTVADTGIGIPKETQRGIFDAFSQGDGTSTRRFEGVGIGLTIAYRLAERMAGHLAVESEIGQGTRFTLRVPMGIPADSDPMAV